MNPWPDVLRDIQSELKRCSQVVDGRSVLPNAVVARLPRDRFRQFGPVLERVTRELGRALVDWAIGAGHEWTSQGAPLLEVRVEERADVAVDVAIVDEESGRSQEARSGGAS